MNLTHVQDGFTFLCVFTGIGLFVCLITTGIFASESGNANAVKGFAALCVLLALAFLTTGFLAFAAR